MLEQGWKKKTRKKNAEFSLCQQLFNSCLISSLFGLVAQPETHTHTHAERGGNDNKGDVHHSSWKPPHHRVMFAFHAASVLKKLWSATTLKTHEEKRRSDRNPQTQRYLSARRVAVPSSSCLQGQTLKQHCDPTCRSCNSCVRHWGLWCLPMLSDPQHLKAKQVEAASRPWRRCS